VVLGFGLFRVFGLWSGAVLELLLLAHIELIKDRAREVKDKRLGRSYSREIKDY